MDSAGDRRPACGFCDGTGLWPDPEGDPAAADPCPLCEGTKVAPPATAGAGEEGQATEAVRTRLLALLPRLT